MSELEDSEDEDYLPEVADRLEEYVELHVEKEENTEASDDNEGGEGRLGGELKMIMMLNILQIKTMMMRMTK